MEVLGAKIREIRKGKKISQHELAKGICTQATISNIETTNRCDSLEIFSRICIRMEANLVDLIKPSSENLMIQLLSEVEQMCTEAKYKEAYELIIEFEEKEPIFNDFLLIKYSYYRGLTALLGYRNDEEALFYLHQGVEKEDTDNIYTILCFNTIATMYELQSKLSFARKFYEKSMLMFKEYKKEVPNFSHKIFYNTAKFYSLVKEYEEAIRLCNKGIALNNEKQSMYYMEHMLYERAFNKYMLGKEARFDYLSAYVFAKQQQNLEALRIIKEDIEQFSLTIDFFDV